LNRKAQKQTKIPSKDGKLGRNRKGQFVKSNQLSIGNSGPTNNKVKELKDALLAAISTEDIKAIIKKLIVKAKGGNIQAAKEVFDRGFGKSVETSDVNVTYPQLSKPLTLKEIKKRIKEAEKAGNGIDQRSIEGGISTS
jgi:hypothetical protein